MRLSLSHAAALLALGAALAVVPGIPWSRGGVRDGSGRVATRGGSHRLDASEAILHPAEGGAPDSTVAADSGIGTSLQQDGDDSPAVTPAAAAHSLPAASPVPFARTVGGPPGTGGRYLRPPGRASPLV